MTDEVSAIENSSRFGKDYWNTILEDHGMPSKYDIDYFNNFYRFGVFDPYNEPDSGREFLFFVKPDLYICQNKTGSILTAELQHNPFFSELLQRWPNVIPQLQSYVSPEGQDYNPFMYLLSNMVVSSLDLPTLNASTVSTPVNMFGTSYDYRWSSEASDDNHSFSLEFKDTKNLDVYMLFRAYEEYEILKAQGVIQLNSEQNGTVGNHYKSYITNHILHDQIGIYKFIVSEDMETIMHYSYFCGCMFMNLPRESFNDADFHEGIKYGIDMKCAFVEDMNPSILSDFNALVSNGNSSKLREFASKPASTYDIFRDHTDLRAVTMPFIIKGSNSMGKKIYKLKWYRNSSKIPELPAVE